MVGKARGIERLHPKRLRQAAAKLIAGNAGAQHVVA